MEVDTSPSSSDTESNVSDRSKLDLATLFGERAPSETSVRSRSSRNSQRTEDEDGEEERWSRLPEVVLRLIYSFLKDNDRANMAVVCKRWSPQFHYPGIWRKRVFKFGGHRANKNEYERAIGFAKYQGRDLRYLTLRCQHPTYLTCKKFGRAMETFFRLLSRRTFRCQLETLIISQLHVDRYWRYDYTRERLVSNLCRFLRSQRDLKLFDVCEGLVPVNAGLRIIDALAKNGGNTMRVINIEDLFVNRSGPYRLSRFQLAMSRFTYLGSLYTNYNYISDDILFMLGRSRCLDFISIKVYKHDPHAHEIDNETWKQMKRFCPRLRVHFYFEGIADYNEVTSLIVRDVPLRSLQVWSGIHHADDNWRLEDLFKYIGDNFGNTLEEACFCLENNRDMIDDGLIYMLLKCRRMEYLDLQAVLLVPTVTHMCTLQQEYKIGLTRCHMTLENLTGVELQELEEMNAAFEPMLHERGLDFNIAANDLPYF